MYVVHRAGVVHSIGHAAACRMGHLRTTGQPSRTIASHTCTSSSHLLRTSNHRNVVLRHATATNGFLKILKKEKKKDQQIDIIIIIIIILQVIFLKIFTSEDICTKSVIFWFPSPVP